MGTLLPHNKQKITVPALEALMTDSIEKDMQLALENKPFRPKVSTEALLNDRAKTHGDYETHARITQRIKAVLYESYTGKHTTAMREALEMNAHKMGRILAGDPDFRDHWDDIAGYAKLVADRCTK